MPKRSRLASDEEETVTKALKNVRANPWRQA
jgi:hypothetical protein